METGNISLPNIKFKNNCDTFSQKASICFHRESYILENSNNMSSKLALPRGRSLQLYLLIVLLISNAVSAFRIGSVPRLTTQLNAVKASSNDKIRVKLLADVKGTGRYASSIFFCLSLIREYCLMVKFRILGRARSYLYLLPCGQM